MDPDAPAPADNVESKTQEKQARVVVEHVNGQDDSDDEKYDPEEAENDEDLLNDWPDETQASPSPILML